MYSFIARQPIFDTKCRPSLMSCFSETEWTMPFPCFTRIRHVQNDFWPVFMHPFPRIANNHSSFINVPHQMIITDWAIRCRMKKWSSKFWKMHPGWCAFLCRKGYARQGLPASLDDFTMDDEWDRFMQYISVSNLMSETMTMKISGNISTEKSASAGHKIPCWKSGNKGRV